ncbi:MAG: serine/threonine protein kinase [Pirellulales bacterium]|nr:serine/threonine protein kinase [Pirellulales bacterium]
MGSAAPARRGGSQESMSEILSSDRPGDEPSLPAQGGTGSDSASLGLDGHFPLRDDQETIISNRPPVAPPGCLDIEAERGPFSPGERLGPYEVVEYVGGGGMGHVYRALDPQLSRIVALKVLAWEQTADAETLQRFRNEARSAARLDHESFARVYGMGEDNGLSYLVFEFVEGTTIRKLVEQRGPLPLGEAIVYTLQVADALAHAASRNVVHRDIKPSNVLVTKDGRAKVIDLGLARVRDENNGSSDLTASGVTLGTFDYISPEQARDPRGADVRSDIYSLGCTFFYMLVGQPPFPEGTVLQKLLQHQGDEPPDVRRLRPELPVEVIPILQKMLAKNPADRFQTPGELVERLQNLASQLGLRQVGPARYVWTAPARPRASFLQPHLPWMASVAALLGIVLLLDFLWSAPAPPGEQPAALAAPAKQPAAHRAADAEPAKSVKPPGDSTVAQPAAPAVPNPAVAEPPKGTANGAAPAVDPPSPATPPAAISPGDLPGAVGGNSPSQSSLLSPLDYDSVWPMPLDADALGSAMSALALPPAPLPDEAAPTGPSTGVLIVGAPRGGSRHFPSLAAALGAAAPGDVVELRYSGHRVEKPTTLPNAKLTIRGAQGFRPVVVFQPDEPDPVKCPRAMLALTGSELSLVNVAFELDIPRGVPADHWTLLELGRGESLHLEKCSLTIRDAYPRQTSFLRVRAPAGGAVAGLAAAATAGPAARIDLVDCIVRGDAVVVDTDPLQPVHLTWTNGLLSTGERLLWARGGDQTPPSGETIQLSLKHLTAAVARGLCRLDGSRQARYQLPLYVDCADTIVIAQPDASLIEQTGRRDALRDEVSFHWSGDRNLYHGFFVFWTFEDVESAEPRQTVEFETWQTRWAPEHEGYSRWERVDFRRLPEAGRPTSDQMPSDYVLSDSVENWARGTAADGADIGFLLDRLPPLPPPDAPWNPPVPAR